jgi:hypothetical protein
MNPKEDEARNEWGVLIRDTYCTPLWFAELMPEVDLDPATNPRSHIRSRAQYMVERRQNGLKLPWRGMLWLNPPYSNPDPWALKLYDESNAGRVTDAGILVNVDSSTLWWRAFTHVCRNMLMLTRRVAFDAPPGVDLSGSHVAQRPQALLATDGFRAKCEPELDAHGVWWSRAAA